MLERAPRINDSPTGPPGRGKWVRASQQADESTEQRLQTVVRVLRERLGNDLVAVVLGGSLARGEGVALADPDGPRLLSDLDVYAVVDYVALAHAGEVGSAVRGELAGDPFLLAPVDLGIVDRAWFSKMGAVLPAFQLAAGHVVLWQRDDRWEHPSAPSTERVDVDDAVRLLHNRFAEELLLSARARHSNDDAFALFHRWKVWYDAPLAWLAAQGAYTPDRRRQLEHLQELAAGMAGSAGAWLRRGADRLARMHAATLAGALERTTLEQVGSTLVARGASPDDAAREVLTWAWPFWRASLRLSCGGTTRAASADLARAAEQGPPDASDCALVHRWLRRAPLRRRLREARRWAPLSPLPLTRWWRHGRGGVGPERVYGSIALRYAQQEGWMRPLAGLFDRRATVIERLRKDPDAELAGIWSGWITGGART